jgi:kumamolisin
MPHHPQFRVRDGRSLRWRAASYSYPPPAVAAAYGLPKDLDGSGLKVGVIELGGAFSPTDYAAAMAYYGVAKYKTPKVVGRPRPDPGGADVEVMLDACVIGGLAPGADVSLYFGDNTDAAFVSLVGQALSDGCDAASISWGSAERNWAAASRSSFDSQLLACVVAGVNVFAASGDNGAGDSLPGRNVDFPAASPYAVGCGGTYTVIQGDQLVSEAGWSDGGGGYSAYEPMPTFQHGLVNGSLRGVPDVSGPADPNSGWTIFSGGQRQSVGGTSAVAPMWAALCALLCQKAGKRVGFLPPLLYAHASAFNDITAGNNGAYNAGPGWDAITGLGTPAGPALFALVGAGPAPPPPPPSVGVTLAQAEAAVATGAAAYAANYPKRYGPLLTGVGPWVDRELTKLPW